MDCGATCQTNVHHKGSAIDFFIVSRQIRPWVTNIHTLDTTLKTHKPVTMHLRNGDRARKLTKYMFEKPGHEPVFVPLLFREASWHKAGTLIQQATEKLTGAQGEVVWATDEQAVDPHLWELITEATRSGCARAAGQLPGSQVGIPIGARPAQNK